MRPLSRSLDVEGVHIEGMTLILLYPATDVMSEIGEGRPIVPFERVRQPDDRFSHQEPSDQHNCDAARHDNLATDRFHRTNSLSFPRITMCWMSMCLC